VRAGAMQTGKFQMPGANQLLSPYYRSGDHRALGAGIYKRSMLFVRKAALKLS